MWPTNTETTKASIENRLIRNTKESDKLFELKAHRLVILDLLRGEQESDENE